MRSGQLCDDLENRAAQFPDRLAAMVPDGASLTYRELDVRPGDRVGLALHFDLSILDIHVPLKHPASIHLIPEELEKNPKELAVEQA
jgi:hypothetical protein